jgi:membrane protease subunit HflC
MGKGDKEAQDIIENATRNSKELFLFLKTMEFYKTNLKSLPIIVGPEGVLRYLTNPMGSGTAPTTH